MKTLNRRIILGIFILLIIVIIFYFENQKIAPEIAEKTVKDILLKAGKYPQSPELTGISGYINSKEGIKISDFRGKVVLIDFWTYSCINCIRTLPHLTDWDKKYKDMGLVIIGVHTPEFKFEKNIENVKEAMERHGINYIVVQDNDYATWSAFKNRFWPRKYLIDKDGFIRYDHVGEGAYEETERKIQELLAETGIDVIDMKISEIEDKTPKFGRRTPELYSGYDFALSRGQNIGNLEGIQPDQTITYSLPNNFNKDVIYLDGTWKANNDNLEAMGDSLIILSFTASSANIVADSLGDIEMEVLIGDSYISKEQAGSDIEFKDGRSFVKITEPRLYNLFDGEYGDYKLTLKVKEGFSFNAFTFG